MAPVEKPDSRNQLPDDPLICDWTLNIRDPFLTEADDGTITFHRAPRDPSERQLQLRILARIAPDPAVLVPPVLVGRKRWVCWRFQIDHETGKILKPPCSPLTGEGIGATKKYQDHFTDFASARAAVKKFGLNGVGLVLMDGDGLVGIDFDGCVTAGVIDPCVQTWLNWFAQTYTEFSPSGHGLHVLAGGAIPKALTKTTIPKAFGSCEMYCDGRYFTFTSMRVGDALDIADAQTSIDKLWSHLSGGKQAETPLHDEYPPMSVATMRRKHIALLAALKKMTQPDDFQNNQLNSCAFFAARAFLVGAFAGATEAEVKSTLRSVAQATRHCPGLEGTLSSGWESGIAAGPFGVLDAAQAQADALIWIDKWLADEGMEATQEKVLEQLALLGEEDYESQNRRVRAAKRLGISKPSKIDEFVEERRQDEDGAIEEPLLPFRDSEPWPEAVNGAALVAAVATMLRRFVVFKHDHDAEVMALWAVGTHLCQEFNVFPRLGFTSPLPECGKTTALDVLEHVAVRATRADNITVAVAFRIMEFSPSLLLDELDTFLLQNPELVGVLNSGHRKGGYVFRVEKVNEKQRLTRFGTFGPVAYGMIGHPSGTLFSRSIFIRLERKSPDIKTEDFNVDEKPTLEEDLTVLRRKHSRWAQDNRERVRDAQPSTTGLANRARDNWRPLLKIAHVLGGEWPRIVLTAAGVPAPRSRKTDQELLLRDLRNIFHTRQVDRLPSTVLLSDLLAQHESGWLRFHNSRDPMDARGLSDLMGDFDLGPKAFFASEELQQKCFGEVSKKRRHLKGYTLEQLTPLFARYLTGEPETVEVSQNSF